MTKRTETTLVGSLAREQLPVSFCEGDAIVVVGIDRLGRNAAEVMTTIR
jgi:hypothetical protein